MKLIRNTLRHNVTRVSSLISSQKVILSCYRIESERLGSGKFEPMWLDPYTVKCVLAKGAYELVNFGGVPLRQTRNGLN